MRLLAGITWKSYIHSFNSNARYVGCIPLGIDVPVSERHQVEEILKELNCFPVFLDEEVLRSHYHGFCKKILWPVLHNRVNMLEWWDELIDRFAEDNIFANRPLMDRYFNSYSIVNDTIARCVEQL